jgi:hypothetical protein
MVMSELTGFTSGPNDESVIGAAVTEKAVLAVYAPAGTEISNPWRSGSDVDPRMEASFPGVATPSAILTGAPTVSVPRAREDGVIAGAGLLLVAVADGPELLQLAMTRVATAITTPRRVIW